LPSSSSSSTEENLNVLCKEIQKLDNSIRFVGIANNLSSLIATAYRYGLTPLMNEQETSHYAIQAVLRATTHENFEPKIILGRQEVWRLKELLRYYAERIM
jgi:hypothetical protein